MLEQDREVGLDLDEPIQDEPEVRSLANTRSSISPASATLPDRASPIQKSTSPP